mmetsp:Transcript_1567/g.2447  ORF Transcript_1567/g.2447 Transcript_1567/m.2447 type:complete len:192 (+) Transcript_1567:89-664(+)
MVTPSPPQAKPQVGPTVLQILILYLVLGSLLSYFAGREPGTLPDDIYRELAPTVIVVCLFLVSYSLLDVMGAGVAKSEHMVTGKKYEDLPVQMPEQVHLALRAQANQVEQLPGFLFAAFSFSLLVNGQVGVVLALVWALLRRRYASIYRNSVGIPLDKKGLSSYTIPAYMAVNAMLMGTAIHAVRGLLATV